MTIKSKREPEIFVRGEEKPLSLSNQKAVGHHRTEGTILMSKNLHVIGGSVLGALALMAAAVMPASAVEGDNDSPVDTVTTFNLEAGLLTFDAPATADLDAPSGFAGASGADDVTNTLGLVTVNDARGGEGGWVVSAASSTFVHETNALIESTSVNYTLSPVTEGGVSDTVATPRTLTEEPQAVVTTSGVMGNNTASWTPTLTVALPDNALAGEYEGTVTTSVL